MKNLYSRKEMLDLNIKSLNSRGVTVNDIAEIAYHQQSKYIENINFQDCIDSVMKILSLRDVFHHVQLGIEIDRLAEEGKFNGPIADILNSDLGLFGVDELVGLDIAGLYGVTGQTNFGDIDVNKYGIVKDLNNDGKTGKKCHTMLDDIVGGIAAAAYTRVAQVINEKNAKLEDDQVSIYDL